jgi:hypothetical protein
MLTSNSPGQQAAGWVHKVHWLLVHVGAQYGLTERRLVVQAGAALSMPASADLEVERTIHSADKDGPR